MKKIGIFLAYAPNQPIKSHGLGRLLAFIMQGMLDSKDKQIVIATPAWHKDTILEFLDDQKIDAKKIQFITTPGIPYILRLRNFFSHLMKKKVIRKPKFSFVTKFLKLCSNIANQAVMKWLSISSTPAFLLMGIFLFVIVILLSPLILTGFLLYLIKRFFQDFLAELKFLLSNTSFMVLAGPIATLKKYRFAHITYNTLRANEIGKLTNLVNKRKDISVWYVPTLFWPEIQNIQAKKVVAAPDIVIMDYPSRFLDAHYYLRTVYENIKKTLTAADHFICYSEYVKEKHLYEKFSIDPAKISVISHGFVDCAHQLKREKSKSSSTREIAISILQDYQKDELMNSNYLRDFDLSSMSFIFYSSQIRPYKNIFNLIQAYEILLRKRFINTKLIITGNPELNDDTNRKIKDYIEEKELQHDVLSFSDVSSKVLAALNHLATLAVTPTLFEGGFPFTFAEAYSVGTPSVMSKIPAVTPLVPHELRDKMLFDPYDLYDMVNKIEWGIKNREELYKLQEPLFEQMKQRTWKIVANEYIDILNQFANQMI